MQDQKPEFPWFYPNRDSSLNSGFETSSLCGHRQALTTLPQFPYLQNKNNYTYLPHRNLVQHCLASAHLFKLWTKLRSNFEHLHKLKLRVTTTQLKQPAKAQQQQNPTGETPFTWWLLFQVLLPNLRAQLAR